MNLPRHTLIALSSLLALSALAPLAQAQETVIRVSGIPDENPTELARKYKPLVDQLQKHLGVKVVYVPVIDYGAAVSALGAGKIDFAWLGGFTFVQARLRTHGKVVPIVQRAEDAKFTSRFITTDPAVHKLSDLRGKTFVFGAPSSTSGSLMPRYYLQQAGIHPEKDFKTVAYSGAHDATVAYVAAGKAQAGVLNTSVWSKLVEEKKVDPAKVRVFYTTPPYHDYNWTVRSDLSPALIQKITHAFLQLNPARPADRQIMEQQRASKFIPTTSSNYDTIEKAARSAGLLK